MDRQTHNKAYKNTVKCSKANLWSPKGKHGWRDNSGAWDEHTHSTVYKIDNQQRPTV